MKSGPGLFHLSIPRRGQPDQAPLSAAPHLTPLSGEVKAAFC